MEGPQGNSSTFSSPRTVAPIWARGPPPDSQLMMAEGTQAGGTSPLGFVDLEVGTPFVCWPQRGVSNFPQEIQCDLREYFGKCRSRRKPNGSTGSTWTCALTLAWRRLDRRPDAACPLDHLLRFPESMLLQPRSSPECLERRDSRSCGSTRVLIVRRSTPSRRAVS